jgi:hypothetical protein
MATTRLMAITDLVSDEFLNFKQTMVEPNI